MNVTGVLHVGAHLAEEAETYDALGIKEVWWVEANPAVLPMIEEKLYAYPFQRIISGLVYSKAGEELDFNVTNYDGMSSSILEFGTHPEFSPDTVFVDKLRLKTTTIDAIAQEHRVKANFLNMDLQGAELHALRGAQLFLRDVAYIMTEVNNAEVYKDCAKVDELDRFLTGFTRVETYWVPDQGWGDALYVRTAK
jgi:FkbM family methyltransferase